MHRTEGANHVNNQFSNGPPGTTIEENWLTAVQEEIAGVIEDAGITLSKTDNTQFLAALDSKYIFPPGTVLSYMGETIPDGWLECDGSSLGRTTYSALFTAIGVIYGNVDGTHFNIPDLQGEFLRGWDNSAGVDPDAAARTDRGDGTVGDNVGTKQSYAVEAHVHQTPIGFEGSGASGATTGALSLASTSGPYGTSTETRPTNVNVIHIIKW